MNIKLQELVPTFLVRSKPTSFEIEVTHKVEVTQSSQSVGLIQILSRLICKPVAGTLLQCIGCSIEAPLALESFNI